MRRAISIFNTIMICLLAGEISLAQDDSPALICGIKMGELTSDSMVVWARLTSGAINPENWPDKHGPQIPGMAGEFRVVAEPYDDQNKLRPQDAVQTDWIPVTEASDYCGQVQLSGLEPETRYRIQTTTRNQNGLGASSVGTITTPGKADSVHPVRFAVVTCQGYHRRDAAEAGHKIYQSMLELDEVSGTSKPEFLVHTGDIVYYDRANPVATNVELARHHWHRMFSLTNQKRFHSQVPTYFMKDDHDTLFDDCWPGFTNPKTGELTFEKGLELFREQVPMGEKTYRTFSWGQDLQIWLVEGRDYRSPNRMDDGPEKTIWGKEQIDWLKRTVAESNASFKILISPTPIVGPDRKTKNDNHANEGFKHEGDWARQFLAEQKMISICGDRHWQYVSDDPESGLREVACGPSSDAHAGGFNEKQRSEHHKFLRIAGGFLTVSVDRENGKPFAIFRHHDVDGNVVNEFQFESSIE